MRRRFLGPSAIGVIVDGRLQANREIKVVSESSRRAEAGYFESNNKGNGFRIEGSSAQLAEPLMPEQ